MAGRNWVMAVTVVGALALGACGSDDNGSDGKGGDAADATLADDGGGATAGTDAGGATDDTAGDDGSGSADTLAADDGSGSSGSVDVVGDPALFALTQLSVDQVCAMIPRADVESIVGGSVTDPSGMQLEALGTNCLYNDATTFDLVAKLEFSVFDWSTVVGLTSFKPEGVPPTDECEIAGRAALCTPEYETDGLSVGAQVYVQLGGDGDIVLFTESSKGLDQAKQLAELAASHLPA